MHQEASEKGLVSETDSDYDTCSSLISADIGSRHTLSKKEKKAYIDAELCLMRKPGKSGLPGATNRHEDLQKVHQMQAGMIHGVVGCLTLCQSMDLKTEV